MADQARPELATLDPRIDRKKFSLTQQTIEAERLMRSRGLGRREAMALAGRNFLAKQAKAAEGAKPKSERRVTVEREELKRQDPTRTMAEQDEPAEKRRILARQPESATRRRLARQAFRESAARPIRETALGRRR